MVEKSGPDTLYGREIVWTEDVSSYPLFHIVPKDFVRRLVEPSPKGRAVGEELGIVFPDKKEKG